MLSVHLCGALDSDLDTARNKQANLFNCALSVVEAIAMKEKRPAGLEKQLSGFALA